MSTLDEARERLDEAARVKLTPYEANVLVRRFEALSRAVAEDVYAGKEAERRQKLDDLKRSIGVPVIDPPKGDAA